MHDAFIRVLIQVLANPNVDTHVNGLTVFVNILRSAGTAALGPSCRTTR